MGPRPVSWLAGLSGRPRGGAWHLVRATVVSPLLLPPKKGNRREPAALITPLRVRDRVAAGPATYRLGTVSIRQ